MKATELLAKAMGLPLGGESRCCFCGASASAEYKLPDSFTAIDRLAAPSSGHACTGCKFAAAATSGQSPDGKPWMWSWIITSKRAEKHALCVMLGGDRVAIGRETMLAACLNPPPAPYAIVLCRSGRTHTMYRAAVHHGGPGATLTYEGESLRYEPRELADSISLCLRIAERYGPKTARDLLPVSAGRWGVDEGELRDLSEWHERLQDPLLAVAACLHPAKESRRTSAGGAE